jgi:hypothetical protein
MLYSLALVALSAAPAQGGELKLTNARIRIGELGPTRPSAKFLPGDLLVITYDINGLAIDPNGVVKYKTAMEVKDAAGKSIFKQDPRDLLDFVPLRGNVIPGLTFVTIGLDQPPGNYVCEITVTDPNTKKSDKVSTKFEVTKAEFGIVGVRCTHDTMGQSPAPPVGVVGDAIIINFGVASFQRDPKTKQPNVELEFQILDDKGNPTLGKPQIHIQDSGVDAKEGAFGHQFGLPMTRPGKFTFKVTATDKVANKKATSELPVTVLPAN